MEQTHKPQSGLTDPPPAGKSRQQPTPLRQALALIQASGGRQQALDLVEEVARLEEERGRGLPLPRTP